MTANPYATPVAQGSVDERASFIWKTYAHVAGAIVAFAAIEAYLISSGVAARIAAPLLGNWLLVLGAFMLVGWGASHVAHRLESKPAQYAAFAVFVFAEAIIFAPMILLAEYVSAQSGSSVLQSAATVTLLGAGGLMAVAMITRRDFSFLRGLLVWGGILALVLIAAAILFGLTLGTWFSIGMIGFAGAAILYDTSNILHHYPQERYVGAAMGLFASIMLMFWYVLQLFLSRD